MVFAPALKAACAAISASLSLARCVVPPKPVTRQNSVAVDPRFVPYGAPVVLEMDRPVASGMWVAQDTGGAIKGPNRFDTFWGNGGDAREIAGWMSARGTALLLLPKGTVARLTGR